MTTLLKIEQVLNTANFLTESNGATTTLEIKNHLIKTVPHVNWEQKFVSKAMDLLEANGDFEIADDNGTYRTYTFVNKTMKESRKKIIEMIKANTGKFITITFIKKSDNTKRVMNCQYIGTDPSYGNLLVLEKGNHKQIDPHTIVGLKANKTELVVK